MNVIRAIKKKLEFKKKRRGKKSCDQVIHAYEQGWEEREREKEKLREKGL